MNPEEKQIILVPGQTNFFKEILVFIAIALIIVVPIRIFVAEPFVVSGLSMYPTFDSGQYLIVDQFTYDFSNPRRGDVVIIKYPLDTSMYFIKRVIGLPGDTVSINSGVVTIYSSTTPKGVTLNEPYIEADHHSYDTSTTTIGANQYFVMGDNRNQSSDSRIWGLVSRDLVVGRPMLRLLPFSTLSVLPGRDTNEPQ